MSGSGLAMQDQALEGMDVTSRRILVVDDEAAIRTVVALCLQKLGGWNVSTAVSGRDALQQARTEKPDAIVLDVMMPGMDGFTFLQHLRADPVTQPIPVVLLTAKSYLPDSGHLSDLGVVLVLAKPFIPIDLVQDIAGALGW